MRKFCAILCTVALTVGMATSAYAEEVNESPSSVNESSIVAVDLAVETANTQAAVSTAVESGALDTSDYTVADDGSIVLQLTSSDGSAVEISLDKAVLVLKSVDKTVMADKYTAQADALSEELAAAEAAGDEETVAKIKTAIAVNNATASVLTAIANGDVEQPATLQAYVDLILAAVAEAEDGAEYTIDIMEVDPETGEVKTPEVELSSLESVTAQTYEVAFTDTDNLVDNGDGTYTVADTDTYIAKNGKSSDHAAAAADDTVESGDTLVYRPTSINVSDALSDFDWEANNLYFAVQDVNASIYLVPVTSNDVAEDIMTISVPATGSGSFYQAPVTEE
ncbi:MAG: hypothetical protein LIP12_16730 [Clostridiales bacterium]|nr:hypothetical protein [Clostridiales bacterium]